MVWILAPLLCAACGGPELRGVVQTMPSRDARGDRVAPRPIVRARVELVCGPGRRVLGGWTTDTAGRVSADLERDVPNGCWFEVSRVGYAPRRIAVIDACAAGSGSRCNAMSLSARLVPEPSP